MRVESIKISNYRQIRNLVIRFDRAKDKKDLHVIYAKNGVGKTNILNAITWCLYDQENHLKDANTALSQINTHLVDEVRQHGGGQEEVSVEISFIADDGDKRIIFKRVADFNITETDAIKVGSRPCVKISEHGEFNVIDNEESMLEILNQYLPESIQKYIFFDGEQLENFFADKEMKNVKTGIQELTQASFLYKAATFVKDYTKRELEAQLASNKNADVSQQQQEVNRIENLIAECDEKLQKHNEQIALCDTEILKCEDIIHGCETVKDKMTCLKDFEIQRDKHIENLADQKTNLIKLVHSYYHLFMMSESVDSFTDYIKTENQNGNLPPKVDKHLLQEVIGSGHCPVCDNHDVKLDYVQRLLETIAVGSTTSNILNRCDGALSNFNEDLSRFRLERTRINSSIKASEQEIKRLDAECSKIETHLRGIPDKEEIAKAIDEKKDYRDKKAQITKRLGIEEEHKKIFENQLSDAQKELARRISKVKDLEDLKRKVDFAKECRAILALAYEQVLNECRDEIQKETFKIYNDLLWKENEYSDVEIMEDFTFRLLDMYGNQSLGSSSAAEMALLAMSFTLALQEVSKHDSLLFIDTPVGRVDDDNRINFIETLLGIANNKQVILTFTPSEYDANIQARIRNEYSSFNELEQHNHITRLKANGN